MPYSTEFLHGGRWARHVGSGVLTGAEVLAGTLEVQEAARHRPITHSLCDLTAVTTFRASAHEIREIAAAGKVTAELAPGGFVAVVAPRDHVFGLARMWETHVDGATWSTRVFRDLNGALAWLDDSKA